MLLLNPKEITLLFTSVPLGSAVHELHKAKLFAKTLKEILPHGENQFILQDRKLLEGGRKEPLAQRLTVRQLLESELWARDSKDSLPQGQTRIKLQGGKQQRSAVQLPLQQGQMGLNEQSGKLLKRKRSQALSPGTASYRRQVQPSIKKLQNMSSSYRSRNLPHGYFVERNKKQISD